MSSGLKGMVYWVVEIAMFAGLIVFIWAAVFAFTDTEYQALVDSTKTPKGK
jgi:hypothetical protein